MILTSCFVHRLRSTCKALGSRHANPRRRQKFGHRPRQLRHSPRGGPRLRRRSPPQGMGERQAHQLRAARRPRRCPTAPRVGGGQPGPGHDRAHQGRILRPAQPDCGTQSDRSGQRRVHLAPRRGTDSVLDPNPKVSAHARRGTPQVGPPQGRRRRTERLGQARGLHPEAQASARGRRRIEGWARRVTRVGAVVYDFQTALRFRSERCVRPGWLRALRSGWLPAPRGRERRRHRGHERQRAETGA